MFRSRADSLMTGVPFFSSSSFFNPFTSLKPWIIFFYFFLDSVIGPQKSLQPERNFGPITMCLSMLYMFIQSFLIEKLEDFKLHEHDCEGVNISH